MVFDVQRIATAFVGGTAGGTIVGWGISAFTHPGVGVYTLTIDGLNIPAAGFGNGEILLDVNVSSAGAAACYGRAAFTAPGTVTVRIFDGAGNPANFDFIFTAERMPLWPPPFIGVQV